MYLIYINDILIYKQKSFEHLDKKIAGGGTHTFTLIP